MSIQYCPPNCLKRQPACQDTCSNYKTKKEEQINTTEKVRADLEIRKYSSEKHDNCVRKGYKRV